MSTLVGRGEHAYMARIVVSAERTADAPENAIYSYVMDFEGRLCYGSNVSKYPANDAKFQLVRDLDLPLGQYAITSSGPLGVREIREIGDIDLVVDDDLWNELASAYPIIEEQGVTKIRISQDIEVLSEGSFYEPRETDQPSVVEQIAQADIIDGLPFVGLRYVLYFKRKMKRAKDERDIAALERLLDQH